MAVTIIEFDSWWDLVQIVSGIRIWNFRTIRRPVIGRDTFSLPGPWQRTQEKIWWCHTIRLLVGVTMIPNVFLSGQFCDMCLVGNNFWAFTLNQPRENVENSFFRTSGSGRKGKKPVIARSSSCKKKSALTLQDQSPISSHPSESLKCPFKTQDRTKRNQHHTPPLSQPIRSNHCTVTAKWDTHHSCHPYHNGTVMT